MLHTRPTSRGRWGEAAVLLVLLAAIITFTILLDPERRRMLLAVLAASVCAVVGRAGFVLLGRRYPADIETPANRKRLIAALLLAVILIAAAIAWELRKL